MAIENWQENGFGLYLHWPFCETKCPYCDFNSYADQSFDSAEWTRVFRGEIDKYAAELPGRTLASIYFGGGTPSLMPAKMVADLIDAATKSWASSNEIEITLEANPSTVEVNKFQDFQNAGVNRVSLGVQALDDASLAQLGRKHSAAEALGAIETVKSIFNRSSFDLIYARQDQTLSDWEGELTRALQFNPTHLSLYQLTIEPGTVFAKRQSTGHLKGLPSDDLGADMYDLTQDLCEAHGLPAYEVSNHATPGQESRHNFIYWNSGDYVGIGPGAHGRISTNGARIATTTALWPKNWLEGRNRETREVIPMEEQLTELFLMGLRTSCGVSETRAQDMGFSRNEKFRHLVEDGFLYAEAGFLKATAKGRPVLNSILQDILD